MASELGLPPTYDEFVTIVEQAAGVGRERAEREGVDSKTAERHTEALFIALARVLSDKEFGDLVAELPKSFSPLLPRGPEIEVISSNSFLQRVADRAGVDLEAFVRRVAERERISLDVAFEHVRAVLSTLREALREQEFLDVIARLPDEYEVALRPA